MHRGTCMKLHSLELGTHTNTAAAVLRGHINNAYSHAGFPVWFNTKAPQCYKQWALQSVLHSGLKRVDPTIFF